MEQYFLTYDTLDGKINDWLVLGPVTTPLEKSKKDSENELDFRKNLITSFSPASPLSNQPPNQLCKITHENKEIFWKLEHCKPDHRIETSIFSKKWEYTQFWAYCCLTSPIQDQFMASLVSGCAVSVWLNGRKIFYSDEISPLDTYVEKIYQIELTLNKGKNHLWLLLENVSIKETILSAQFRINSNNPQLKAAIPVLSKDLEYWKLIEGIYEKLSISRAVYSSSETIVLKCSDNFTSAQNALIKSVTPQAEYLESSTAN